jgi:hypothetical protein
VTARHPFERPGAVETLSASMPKARSHPRRIGTVRTRWSIGVRAAASIALRTYGKPVVEAGSSSASPAIS